MITTPAEGEDVWVFAYGSLIWQPDFQFEESRLARLYGWHRALCILSYHYRGTREAPGLVLGLDRGGSCVGLAYRVGKSRWAEVRDRLDARELISGVYLSAFRRIHLDDGRKVSAYIFIADRRHPQYWSGPFDQAARLVRGGIGSKGSALEYLSRTLEELEERGIRDTGLLGLKLTLTLNDGTL